MRELMKRAVPLWIIIAVMVGQATVTYAAVSVLYYTEVAAFGTLTFTGEVEIVGMDIQDESTISVVLRRTLDTEEGIVYVIGVAADNTMGSETVTWQPGDPDTKKILITMDEPISTTVTMIKLRVMNSGEIESL